MKSRLFSVWTVAAALAAVGVVGTGCSVMDTVRKQFSAFHEAAMVAGTEPVVYATAQTCLEDMGYVHERGSPSGHRLEMATPIQPGGSAQNLRQRRVILEFTAMGSEGTDVKIGFWEMSEETSQKDNANVVDGGKLVRGGILYQVFWDKLGKALPDEPTSGQPTPVAPPTLVK